MIFSNGFQNFLSSDVETLHFYAKDNLRLMIVRLINYSAQIIVLFIF